MEIADQLRALEEGLLQTAVRKDASQVAELLADDFREFESSGRVYSKPEMIVLLREQEPIPMSLMDFEVSLLAPSVALVTYRALRERPNDEPAQSLRSSLWELRGGRWQIVFHQGTTVLGTKIPAE